MKRSIFFIVSIMWLLYSCNKSDDTSISKEIYVTPINDTVTLSDSCPLPFSGCTSYIVEICNNNTSDTTAIIKSYYDSNCICDGYYEILLEDGNNNVMVLSKDQKIYSLGTWTNSYKTYSLDNFAGKGEKYFGYRTVSYPSGIIYYYYSWLKIELSADKKTLKIIEMGSNFTPNQYILAGESN